MNEPEPQPAAEGVPADPPLARVTPRTTSWAWLVPAFAALLVAGLLLYQAGQQRGPRIQILFDEAVGIDPGAEIVHRGITVGVVRTVELTPDLARVRVSAELAPHAAALAIDGTEFWIVRPELSLQRVSGLETLIGPRYIAVRPGPEGAIGQRTFEGLAEPPVLERGDRDALTVEISATRLGSIAVGSAVVYRDIPVGSVRSCELAEDATGVVIVAEIEPGFAALIRENTRFWRSSGVGVDWGLFRGLSVQAESIDALLTASVSLATPNRPGPRVGPGHAFELAERADDDWLEWDPEIQIDRP